MDHEDELLLTVLNSAPVTAGERADLLTGRRGAELAAGLGGTGSAEESTHLRAVRDTLQELLRGDRAAAGRLTELLGDAVRIPVVAEDGVRWELRAPREQELGAQVVQAWSRLSRSLPGRIRPCANDECNLFLIDRSRPGTAKWCSMAACGNRMKARTHANRQREAAG